MSDLLIVVDMQNDFLTGVFGSKYAESVIKPLSSYAHSFSGDILFTRDTHYKNEYSTTLEGMALPLHCDEGTPGHQLCDELLDLVKDGNVINKPTFASVDLIEKVKDYSDIYLVGVCTDICVISNAFLIRAHYPNKRIYVIEELCRGLNEKTHDAAILVMKSCLVEIV